jgi:type II secretory pathway predicted ATPase ExeA
MRNPTAYLKMRVPGAIDMAPGNSIQARIKAVSQQTFTDEDGHPRQFTWRTIQTWFTRYQKHGVTVMENQPRSDKGKVRKVTLEDVLEALRKVRPKAHGKTPTLALLFRIHRAGQMLVPVIDDAHLMPADCLRKLRLLCEDFPRSHNLVLIGQPPLLQSLSLSVNEEIRSRVTYSVVLPRLSPETIEAFILGQLDRAGLGHNTFTAEALALIVRTGEGLLRRSRNLCLSSLIEAVRDQTRIVDLKQVNRVLIQPHWRKDCDQPLA